jgi:selenocysteine lyase/cysteine desulfurase
VRVAPLAESAESPGSDDREGRTDFAALRAREFARLDAAGTAYLDYTGAALYPKSLVERAASQLMASIYGNPHSESAASRASTTAIEAVRAATLRFLDADPRTYEVVLTANASAAIRILAEAFPFGRRSRLVLTADNHNSVNGLRLSAERAGTAVAYVPLGADLRAADPDPWLTAADAPSLFCFPAQSNFSGVRHSLAWVGDAQSRGYRVLLDAAAFVASSRLSLTATPADFVALSFYKMFGYPTGVGALIARRDALAGLRRRYFAGGTVQFASVQNRLVRLKEHAEAFEDGTANFLAMPAVLDGLRWLECLSMTAIERHVSALAAALLEGLCERSAHVKIYGPPHLAARGGTVAFNLHRRGRLLPYEEVEAAARRAGVAIRGGCFCNPGAAEHAFELPKSRSAQCLRRPFTIRRFRACVGGPAVGALRASLGVANTPADLDRLFACLDDLTH